MPERSACNPHKSCTKGEEKDGIYKTHVQKKKRNDCYKHVVFFKTSSSSIF